MPQDKPELEGHLAALQGRESTLQRRVGTLAGKLAAAEQLAESHAVAAGAAEAALLQARGEAEAALSEAESRAAEAEAELKTRSEVHSPIVF